MMIKTQVPADIGLDSDSDLLTQFCHDQDEAAFAELVRRHGPLVMGVCLGILGHCHDAQDSFQATFLVLATRANNIKHENSLASWLYKVAYRTSIRAAKKRRAYRTEPIHDEFFVTDDPLMTIYMQSLHLALHEELTKLPASYRGPIVLCYLQGKTRQQAADELECSDAAIKAKLARAKGMLRARLSRRGVAMSVALSTSATGTAVAHKFVEEHIIAETVAMSFTCVGSGFSNITTSVANLANGANTLMPFPLTTKLTAAIAASGILLMTLAWMPASISADDVTKTKVIRVAQDELDQQTESVIGPVQQVSNDVGFGFNSFPQATQDQADQNRIRSEIQYVEKRSDAYFLLRDAELERAKTAPNAAGKMEAAGRAKLHEAEAEKLAREAARLQNSITNASFDFAEGSGVAEPAPCCRINNLAYGRSVTASSQEEIINNLVQLAVDGDLSTRWCATDYAEGEWIQVDLGSRKDLSGIRIHWEMMDTKYSYKIETSGDGEDWTEMVNTSEAPAAEHMPEHKINAPGVQFVRITFLGSDVGYWASIREIEVTDGELAAPPVEEWEQVRSDAEGGSAFGMMLMFPEV